jgi:polysaccharide biosynthesis protein PslG
LRRAALLAGLLLASALSGCFGGGGGSSKPSVDPFYGVIPAEPLPGADKVKQLTDARIGTLRINLAWGTVQSGPDAQYDWSHYDDLVGNAARNGIHVLATVFSSPTWAEPTPEQPPLGGALPGFEDFVRAAVQRYGQNGSFWREHAEVPKVPITDWQLWNEQNSPLFWKPAPDASQYLELLRAFKGAVDGADPGARILLGGLFPTPKGGPSAEAFLTDLYQPGGAGLFDAAAIHPYATNPQEAITAVEDARGVMDRFSDEAKPIWVTELGWADGGAPSGVTVSGPQQQAEYLTQAFQLAVENRDRLKIAGVIWYSLQDTPGPAWPGHCGLFTLDGAPKPSWDALVKLTGGSS